MDQYQWNQQWAALSDALQREWGKDFETNAYWARRVLDAGGEAHLQKLMALPLAAQVQVAQAYARVGQRQGSLSPQEARLGAELLADQKSEYWQRPQDPELAAGAKALVSELFEAAAGGQMPADPQAPVQVDPGEVPIEVQEQVTQLMADPRHGPYWNSQHPLHASVRRQVQALLEGKAQPHAPGALPTRPATPAAAGMDPTTALERAREIMADRNGPYRQGSSHPQHDAARAEVARLMTIAYPEPTPAAGEGGEPHE